MDGYRSSGIILLQIQTKGQCHRNFNSHLHQRFFLTFFALLIFLGLQRLRNFNILCCFFLFSPFLKVLDGVVDVWFIFLLCKCWSVDIISLLMYSKFQVTYKFCEYLDQSFMLSFCSCCCLLLEVVAMSLVYNWMDTCQLTSPYCCCNWRSRLQKEILLTRFYFEFFCFAYISNSLH